MDKLIEARKIISEADKQIAELFQQRMNAVKQVAEYKKERGLPVFDPAREDELIKRNRDHDDALYNLTFGNFSTDTRKKLDSLFKKETKGKRKEY